MARTRPRCFALVLGSAQDGGVPHMGCDCAHCRLYRKSRRHRFAASLALVMRDSESQPVVMIDAGPDLRRQVRLIPQEPGRRGRRRVPFDAIMLTHLHMGHCAGLLELGPEVLDSREVPVFCTAAVAEVLANNAPWSLLVSRGNIRLRHVVPGQRFEPMPGWWAEAFSVPHRDEFGDTVGYVAGLAGGKSVLYIPDADNWDGLPAPLAEMVLKTDWALLDGTFFDRAELASVTGRDPSDVPHPPVRDTLALLDGLLARVVFTHLNHTNPLVRSDSPQTAELALRGAAVAAEGMRLSLLPGETALTKGRTSGPLPCIPGPAP